MRRSAYRSQYRGRGSPQRVDTAQNTARAAGQTGDRRLRGARRPLPTRHHGKAHRTTLLAILHQPKEGALYYCGIGVRGVSLAAPLEEGDRETEGMGRGKVYEQGGTGGL